MGSHTVKEEVDRVLQVECGYSPRSTSDVVLSRGPKPTASEILKVSHDLADENNFLFFLPSLSLTTVPRLTNHVEVKSWP